MDNICYKSVRYVRGEGGGGCVAERPLRQFKADVLLMAAAASLLYTKQDSLPPKGQKAGILSKPKDTK